MPEPLKNMFSEELIASLSSELKLVYDDFNNRPERSLPGKVGFFWGVGKPIRHKGNLYLGFAKVGKFGRSFFETGEFWFLGCSNIESGRNSDKLRWQTLPEGDFGLARISHGLT